MGGCFYGQTDRQRATFEEEKEIPKPPRTNKDVVCEFEFNRFNRFRESMEKKTTSFLKYHLQTTMRTNRQTKRKIGFKK